MLHNAQLMNKHRVCLNFFLGGHKKGKHGGKSGS